MASHIKIAVGLLIAAIFFWRGIEAISSPGLGWQELYVVGGFILAGLIIRSGWLGVKAQRTRE